MVPPDMSTPTGASFLPQRQPGLVRIRFAISAGDLTASTAEALASLADSYGRGQIRTTPRHELEIPFVREADAETVVSRLKDLGLRTEGVLARPNVVACPGADQCTSAFVNTKPVCRSLEACLREDAAVGPLPPGLRVAVSGCPNECSHASVNHIGFVGAVGVYGGKKLRGFELLVGGYLEGDGRLGERIAFVSPDDVAPALRVLIDIYREAAQDGQPFDQFYEEMGDQELTARLHGKLSQRMWFFEI